MDINIRFFNDTGLESHIMLLNTWMNARLPCLYDRCKDWQASSQPASRLGSARKWRLHALQLHCPPWHSISRLSNWVPLPTDTASIGQQQKSVIKAAIRQIPISPYKGNINLKNENTRIISVSSNHYHLMHFQGWTQKNVHYSSVVNCFAQCFGST